MQILALRTSTLYVKPSSANCLSTETVRVRRSAKVDIKLLCEQDGFLPYNQAASSAHCFRGGGGFSAKIMKTWPASSLFPRGWSERN